MTSSREIMFCAELSDGKLHRCSLELATLCRRLADELSGVASAILISADAQDLATELVFYGIDKVYVADDPQFKNYQPEAYSLMIERICREVNPDIFVFGHTLHGVDLAPRLAWRLKTGLVTDSIDFRIDHESKKVLVTRAVYGGKALAVMTSNATPLIATLRSKAVSPAARDETRTGQVIQVQLKMESVLLRIKYIKRVREEAEGIKIEDANVVICGGRGLGRAENITQLQELANILGGAVGGTRCAIDNGWLPSTRQIGLSGTIVNPDLYIGVGVSGATQHMVGCASSQCIVAINIDSDAAIFQWAHFGIVADFKKILPTIINLCKSA